jgi:NADP-dependent 3-hydroxy acid dehydrogenase YdfG
MTTPADAREGQPLGTDDPATPATGRVALITGASTGIGAATARRLAAAGWRLVLGARSLDTLEALAAELGGNDVARAQRLDVTEWQSNLDAAAVTIDAFGRIDAVFANAGFGAARGFLVESPEQWRSMVDTNVTGAAYTVRATLPELLRTRGHVLLTSSTAGRRVLPGSMYSVTKHAVTAMGEALRQEVTDAGVRVTLIEPGMTDTPFFDDGTPEWALVDDDIARAVQYALDQPPHVTVCEVLVRPTNQVG